MLITPGVYYWGVFVSWPFYQAELGNICIHVYTYIYVTEHINMHIYIDVHISETGSHQSFQFQSALTGLFLASLISYLYVPSFTERNLTPNYISPFSHLLYLVS